MSATEPRVPDAVNESQEPASTLPGLGCVTTGSRFPTPAYINECLKSVHPHLITDPIMRAIIAQEVHKWIMLVEADAREALRQSQEACRVAIMEHANAQLARERLAAALRNLKDRAEDMLEADTLEDRGRLAGRHRRCSSALESTDA